MKTSEGPQKGAHQPVVQQRQGTASLESPQGEHLAQLETMANASPQADRLAQLAAAANHGPQATAQRRSIAGIHASPHVTAQRQQLDTVTGEAAQLQEAEEPLRPELAQREEAPAKPNNTGLPDNLKSGIESLSGLSMDNVRVHYNSSQPAQLNAHAYAQGTDIHLAPGQEQHLPHEAWHVVQQAQGRVLPTMQMKGDVPINDDKSLEHEADVMGARSASAGVVQRKSTASAPSDSSRKILQRLLNDEEKGPLNGRCLELERRIETAIESLPATMRMNSEHQLIDKVRMELQRVRAPYGTDDREAITGVLDGYENTIVALEGNIGANLDAINNVANIWDIFADSLGDLQSELDKIKATIYRGKIDDSQLTEFDSKIQRTVSMTKKGMQDMRKNDRNGAVGLVTKYTTAGYIGINTINKFYASSYDAAEDDFGASASLYSKASSGSFQWIRDFEYHIHASVVRAGGPGTEVTGFEIKTGHIKPSDEEKALGLSITVPDALNNSVIAESSDAVIRWANGKNSAVHLRKQKT